MIRGLTWKIPYMTTCITLSKYIRVHARDPFSYVYLTCNFWNRKNEYIDFQGKVGCAIRLNTTNEHFRSWMKLNGLSHLHKWKKERVQISIDQFKRYDKNIYFHSIRFICASLVIPFPYHVFFNHWMFISFKGTECTSQKMTHPSSCFLFSVSDWRFHAGIRLLHSQGN